VGFAVAAGLFKRRACILKECRSLGFERKEKQHHKDDQLRTGTDTDNSSPPAVIPRPTSSAIFECLPQSKKTAEEEDDVLSR